MLSFSSPSPDRQQCRSFFIIYRHESLESISRRSTIIIMSAAQEAIARARAIAARLAGTAPVSATTSQTSYAPVPPPAAYSAYAPAAPAPAAAAGGVVQVDAATARAAEEALAMAFGPSGGGGGGVAATSAVASASAKRKRWGDDGNDDAAAKKPTLAAVDPAVARTADLAQQALLAAMSGGGAAAGSASAAKVTRKLPIPTEQFPGYNFVGLLIGPGGSKQRELVQKAGGFVKISVRGDSNGGGTEPLHVLLEGSKECVDRADEMISELLKDPKKADEEKVRTLTLSACILSTCMCSTFTLHILYIYALTHYWRLYS